MCEACALLHARVREAPRRQAPCGPRRRRQLEAVGDEDAFDEDRDCCGHGKRARRLRGERRPSRPASPRPTPARPVVMRYRSQRFTNNGTLTATMPDGEQFQRPLPAGHLGHRRRARSIRTGAAGASAGTAGSRGPTTTAVDRRRRRADLHAQLQRQGHRHAARRSRRPHALPLPPRRAGQRA